MPAGLSRAVCALLMCATVALTATACGDIRRPPPVDRTAPATSAPPDDPARGARCFATGFRPTVLTTADGVPLAAVRLGAGPRGLVLLNEEGADMCRWAGFGQWWAAAGYHVLLFDLRCTGSSECGDRVDYLADTAAAVGELRRHGATRVVLVGASLGATVALVAGARLAWVDGVVALSPHSLRFRVTPAGDRPATVRDAVGAFRAPLLLVQTERDPLAMPAADAAGFVAAAPSGDKRLVLRAGTAHGCGLLHTGGEIPALVDGFLAEHTR